MKKDLQNYEISAIIMKIQNMFFVFFFKQIFHMIKDVWWFSLKNSNIRAWIEFDVVSEKEISFLMNIKLINTSICFSSKKPSKTRTQEDVEKNSINSWTVKCYWTGFSKNLWACFGASCKKICDWWQNLFGIGKIFELKAAADILEKNNQKQV
jgi:hypothetical protein